MGIGADRKVCPVDAIQLGRVGVNVDKDLVGVIGRDQSIAIRRGFTQPRPDRKDEVRRLDPFDQFGVWSIAQIACPYRTVVVYGVLRRNAPATGKPIRVANCAK